jgi:nitroreductase
VRLFFITAMVTFYIAACPRPIDQGTMKHQAHSNKSKLKTSRVLSAELYKGPPELPDHLKAAMAKHRGKSKNQPADSLRHENRLRQRTEKAEMLLLTAEREQGKGQWQAAQQMCAQARSFGAGIVSIGYRPHLCVSEILAAQEFWDQVLYRFENKTKLKENWAGHAHWQLLGARALIEKGHDNKALEVLEKIKKKPEVASEVQRLLRDMGRK